MAWTGSEAEIVGDSVAGGDSPRASDVELVSSSEAWELVPTKKEVKTEPETTVDDLATSLQAVNIIEDEVDFSPDPPKEAEGSTTSNQQPSEPKEPDVSPATDNPSADKPMTAADPPPTDDAAASKATDYIPPSKRVTSLSTNQPLEPLEATDGDAAAPTPIKPTSKAAAIGKVSKRKRDFLVPGGGPTSGDEMPPPTLEPFLRGTRPKSKPAPKTSRNDQKTRDESPSKKASNKMPSRLDVSLQKGQFSSGPIKPLPKVSTDALVPMPADGRKKPMAVLPMASPPSEDWKDRKHRFLSDTYGDLCKSWKSRSMAWTNLHVAAYFHDLPGLTHPRQLAACALRSDSNSEFRWSCWACQLNPEEASLSGFSPSKSCWHSDAQQLYHWWGTHAKQSHWDWLREAESFHVTHKELVTFLLGCDLEEWPLPWTTFALDAIPRELPQKLSGHNPRVFEPPFLRKVTSANAPSEMYRYAAVPKRNRPVSPEKPPSAPRSELTDWVGQTQLQHTQNAPKKSWLSS